MWILGAVLMLHGAGMLIAAIGAAVGYVQRDQMSDAVGTMLTFGVSAVAETVFGLTLIL